MEKKMQNTRLLESYRGYYKDPFLHSLQTRGKTNEQRPHDDNAMTTSCCREWMETRPFRV